MGWRALIAADTNILVRYLALDNPEQAQLAAVLIESDTELFISIPVLCELVWVLTKTFRYSATEVALAVRTITAPKKVRVDRVALRAGLEFLDSGEDFADGCILADALHHGCDRLMTFDRDLVKRGGGTARLLS